MIHETRNYREAITAYRPGMAGAGAIMRPVIGGYIVFDRVEEARGHPTALVDSRAARYARSEP